MDGYKAEKYINYFPRYTFEEGLKEIFEEMKGLKDVPEKY